MPELPEVEHAVRRLRAAMEGRTVRRIRTLHASFKRRLPRARARLAEGRAVREVYRAGKYQIIELDGDVRIVAHFRLDGDWAIGVADDDPPRFARAAIELDDGRRVALEDPRALATLTVHRGREEGLPAIGPDPTDRTLRPRDLAARLEKRKVPIKLALMDQRIIAGVGNIYAAEALWLARIHPARPARSLDAPDVARLLRALRTVLAHGDPRSARYRSDRGDRRLAVYDRAGEPCRRCRAQIDRTIMGGRGTYFCPGCQE